MKITSTQSSLRYSQSTNSLLLDAAFVSPITLVFAIGTFVGDPSIWWAALLWIAFGITLLVVAVKSYAVYKGEIQSGILTVEKKKINDVSTYTSLNIDDIDHFVLSKNIESDMFQVDGDILWRSKRQLSVVKRDKSVTVLVESSFTAINPLVWVSILFSKQLTVKQAERLAAYVQRPLVRQKRRWAVLPSSHKSN